MSAVLLDTHTWVWLVNGDKDLTPAARKAIDKAVQSGGVYLAVVSLWEVAMLEAKQRLILALPCLEWLQQAVAAANAELISLTPEVASESCQLPGAFHGDPADRIIVASARIKNLTLITRDTHILNYSRKHYVSVLKS